jgi:hypothetical protein
VKFAAIAGHRSGRATPSLRDAPKWRSMETNGREAIYRNRNAVQTNPATSERKFNPLVLGQNQTTADIRCSFLLCCPSVWAIVRQRPSTRVDRSGSELG